MIKHLVLTMLLFSSSAIAEIRLTGESGSEETSCFQVKSGRRQYSIVVDRNSGTGSSLTSLAVFAYDCRTGRSLGSKLSKFRFKGSRFKFYLYGRRATYLSVISSFDWTIRG